MQKQQQQQEQPAVPAYHMRQQQLLLPNRALATAHSASQVDVEEQEEELQVHDPIVGVAQVAVAALASVVKDLASQAVESATLPVRRTAPLGVQGSARAAAAAACCPVRQGRSLPFVACWQQGS